jgi:hypothetical protein
MNTHSFFLLSKRKTKEHGLEREKRRANTSFRWENLKRLRLPQHMYGTTLNKNDFFL